MIQSDLEPTPTMPEIIVAMATAAAAGDAEAVRRIVDQSRNCKMNEMIINVDPALLSPSN